MSKEGKLECRNQRRFANNADDRIPIFIKCFKLVREGNWVEMESDNISEAQLLWDLLVHLLHGIKSRLGVIFTFSEENDCSAFWDPFQCNVYLVVDTIIIYK